MVEVVGVEVVDDLDRAGVSHVHLQRAALEDADDRRRIDLVRVVLADPPAVVADAVRVGLAAREEQHPVVLERERGHEHELGRLEVLAAVRVEIADARRPSLVVDLDLRDLALAAHRVAARVERDREPRRLRARLRVDLASEARAEAAVETAAPLVAEGIGERLREDARRLRERVQAEVLARLGEHLAVRRHVQGGVRVRPAARALERVAARDDLPVQVARLAGGADVVLERVVVRLELVVGDAPVLDGAALGDLLLAVALDHVRAVAEVGRQEAPELARPVHHRAAESLTRVERAVLPHRQRRGTRVRPPRPRLPLEVDHHRVAPRVAEAVVVVRERRVAPASRALLEGQHVVPGRTELRRDDRRRHARADRDDVDLRMCLGHAQPSVREVPEIGRITCFAGEPGFIGGMSRSPWTRRLGFGPCVSSFAVQARCAPR